MVLEKCTQVGADTPSIELSPTCRFTSVVGMMVDSEIALEEGGMEVGETELVVEEGGREVGERELAVEEGGTMVGETELEVEEEVGEI